MVRGAWRIWAFIVFLLSAPVGLTALAEGAGLLRLPYELYLIKLRIPTLFASHMLASGLALLLTPWVFLSAGRSVHRHLGRITAALVLVGGITALPVALASVAVPVARAGFFAQGLVWLACDILAVAAIRRGDAARHQRLTLAMAAITSAAVWLRLVTLGAVAAGAPFDAVYGAAAWACWLGPLAVVAALGFLCNIPLDMKRDSPSHGGSASFCFSPRTEEFPDGRQGSKSSLPTHGGHDR